MTRVLFVDDDREMCDAMSSELMDHGLDVAWRSDAVSAFELLGREDFDVLITDLNMPVMNGIEFIRKYRQHPSSKGVPIILLTTESDEELKRQAKEAGATGWIVKPFKQDQLLAVIKKVTGA